MSKSRALGSALGSSMELSFGEFVFDRSALKLSRQGAPVHLTPQSLRLLSLMLESDGRLVTRQEVQETLWPDRTVDFEQGLGHCVRKLRESLGDRARDPIYVETVPRLGFRFLAPVTCSTGVDRKAGTGVLAVLGQLATAWRTPTVVALCAVGVLGLVALVAVRTGVGASDEEPSHRLDQRFSASDSATAPTELQVQLAPQVDPQLRARAQLFADYIPPALAEALGRDVEGTLTVGFNAETAPARLQADLLVPGYPRLQVELVPPAALGVQRIAEDLGREFARQLRLGEVPSNATVREEVVTIDRPGERPGERPGDRPGPRVPALSSER